MDNKGRNRVVLKLLIGAFVVVAATWGAAERHTAATTGLTTLTAPYTTCCGGSGLLSMVLDASGNPVVSYVETSTNELLILHCDDPDCDGIGESLTAPTGVRLPFSEEQAGTSILLDAAGNPVVAYFTWDTADNGEVVPELRLLHCNDPNCDGADESVTSLATGVSSVFDGYSSFVLDAAGHPVISYMTVPVGLYPGTLNVLHCDDPNCDGIGDSITSPVGDLARYSGHTSIALDGSGYPVISYYDSFDPNELVVMHCNDVNCAGGDESIEPQVTLNGAAFSTTSLVLDALGNPIVAYGHQGLWLLHCDDPDCTGAGESLVALDLTTGGSNASLALDQLGNPIISYQSSRVTKLAHCANPTCSTGTSTFVLDANADYRGSRTSLAFDPFGNPVVAFDDTHDLKIAHCRETTCGNIDSDGDGCVDIRELSGLNDVEYGGARDPKDPYDFYDVAIAGGVKGQDGQVDLFNDIVSVIDHYAPVGTEPEYDVWYDRGPTAGPNDWNMTAPDGKIDLFNDVVGVIAQFGHDCR